MSNWLALFEVDILGDISPNGEVSGLGIACHQFFDFFPKRVRRPGDVHVEEGLVGAALLTPIDQELLQYPISASYLGHQGQNIMAMTPWLGPDG